MPGSYYNFIDATYTTTTVTATYEWVSIPDRANNYKKKYYLSGGWIIDYRDGRKS